MSDTFRSIPLPDRSYDQTRYEASRGFSSTQSPSKGAQPKMKSDPVECSNCKGKFQNPNDYRRHLKPHIPCPKRGCSATFRRDKTAAYWKHVETKHPQLNKVQIKRNLTAWLATSWEPVDNSCPGEHDTSEPSQMEAIPNDGLVFQRQDSTATQTSALIAIGCLDEMQQNYLEPLNSTLQSQLLAHNGPAAHRILSQESSSGMTLEFFPNTPNYEHCGNYIGNSTNFGDSLQFLSIPATNLRNLVPIPHRNVINSATRQNMNGNQQSTREDRGYRPRQGRNLEKFSFGGSQPL
ncbi:MAG: hypothetical protein M1834_005941 [Cirrosporium novae-zelandiae]|nr:MAG: hypothetical protein M1834_005941 [Cirrosporium novae-zelandiae]